MKVNKILIVDDDPEFRTLLKMQLQKIAPAAWIDQLDPVEKGRPDHDFQWSQYQLLFLGYELGQEDNGLDWLQEIRNEDIFPATIILTEYSDEDIAVRSILSGAHGYISKENLSYNRLQGVIQNALEYPSGPSLTVNTRDLTTSIYNRTCFHQKLRDWSEKKKPDERLFLFQVVIDDFPTLRNKMGLFAADRLVSEVARDVMEILDSPQYVLNVTRTGDATMGCIVNGMIEEDTGKNLAAKLCEQIANKSFPYADEMLTPVISIGVAEITSAGTSIEQLLQDVDDACALASAEMENSFVVLAGEEHSGAEIAGQETKEDIAPGLNLQEAIDSNRINALFQRLIALSESAMMFDADFAQLDAYLTDEQGNIITPDGASSACLKDGDSGLLDRWLIRYGLGKLLSVTGSTDMQRRGLIIPLSKESLITTDFSGWLAKLILKTKISSITSTIVFAISPSDFLSTTEETLNIMSLMRDKWGLTFALKDVDNVEILNTCLQRGGFEFVKFSLDKERIENMRAIAICCRELGSLTILQNIQDGEDRAYAAHAGIDFLMGDFIRPPEENLVL